MAVLSNAKHERFAQEVAKGKSADEAYKLAGYQKSRKNASRLRANEDIRARVEDILSRAAVKATKTVEDLLTQLEEDRAFARELAQPASALAATMGQAKLLGYLRDKVEHTGKDGAAIEVANVSSLDRAKALAALVAKAKSE